MAARRLWSVREVGMHALAEAGLALADVDQEQEVSDKRIHDGRGRGDGSVYIAHTGIQSHGTNTRTHQCPRVKCEVH